MGVNGTNFTKPARLDHSMRFGGHSVFIVH